MKIFLTLILVWAGFSANCNSQIINKVPLSSRQTAYNIEATLDPVTKIVTGRMAAYWVNMSTDIVPDIQLHLYLNGFKNSRSTLISESPVLPRPELTDSGKIDIKKFTDRSGIDLMPAMKFISPDDGNPFDQTVLKVTLPKPSMPGDTVFINIKFETKLPFLSRRSGYNDDYFFVAQWFPKFGVYESAGMRYALKGAWNCHQYHSVSEFFSNHSVYDVKITVPKEFIVGTCGKLMSVTDTLGHNKTLIYRAEDIVDFAWTAWPGFARYTDHWKGVEITLLSPPERVAQVKRQFTAVKDALEYYDENVGPYPWPYVTIVDPPFKGLYSGGMEYTTMFTSLSLYMMPDFFHVPEVSTIHELGHAYFMGILASNEFEEPWMDEGINSFWEDRIADHYYGNNSGMIGHPFLKVSDKSIPRRVYISSEDRQDVTNKEYSWNYPHYSYSMMSYSKTATWLYTLMGIVGEKTTNEIFKEYYRKWAFKYPSGKDFVNVVNEVVPKLNGNKFGADMNWFFDQTLYGTGLCDYKISEISNEKIEKFPVSKNDSLHDVSKTKDQQYKSTAKLERAGEIMLPVDVLIHFDNGDEILESWDGKSRFKDFVYTGSRTIEWVKIDPEFKIRMDINYINNSKTLKPDNIPVHKISVKLISFMQFLISLISL